MNKLTESEKLMYDVMCAIAIANVPIIFKGAMVTKLILQENKFDTLARETQDIDASWAGKTPPTMEQMTKSINNALTDVGLVAVAEREYSEKKSAGFKIVGVKDNIELFMDIDMRATTDKRKYHYGNVTFEGATPDNIISDKISVISSKMVFRRSKDLIDVYALSNCVTVKAENIRNIWAQENRTIGTFDEFRNRQDDLRHAYEKLIRVKEKPDFDLLYAYLTRFLSPFMDATLIVDTWEGKRGNWTDAIPCTYKVNEINHDKPSILEGIEANKKKRIPLPMPNVPSHQPRKKPHVEL